MEGISSRAKILCFGRYALQALEPTWIISRQIEAERRALSLESEEKTDVTRVTDEEEEKLD